MNEFQLETAFKDLNLGQNFSAAKNSLRNFKEKIDELKFIQKQRERKNGIDVYSLAIGEQKIKSTKADSIEVIKFREFLSMLNVKFV